MTGRWAATNTLREGITPFCDSEERVVNYERGGYSYSEHREDCLKCRADAALALVETALDAAQTAADVIVGDPDFPGRAPMTITRGQKECVGNLDAALRAVREGK